MFKSAYFFTDSESNKKSKKTFGKGMCSTCECYDLEQDKLRLLKVLTARSFVNLVT